MTFAALLPLIVWAVPKLVSLAEGIFSWGSKTGVQKKEFVTTSLKTIVDGFQEKTTGGAKNSWDNLAPSIDMLIEGAVGIGNAVGFFEDENAAISRGA